MGREGPPGHVQLVQTGGAVVLTIAIMVVVTSIFTMKRL
jgi:hypothetical protein